MEEDYLVHYGVLGMKWGVRRYQNKDGSLTAAGARRYGYDPKTRQYVKKSRKTRSLERTADSKREWAGYNEALGSKWGKRSAELHRKQAEEAERNAKYSFKKDVIKQTQGKQAYKKALSAEKEFAARYNKNWVDSYNSATDVFNKKLSQINKKYSKYDFRPVQSMLKGDKTAEVSEKTVKAWNSYVKEVGNSWTSTYSKRLLSDFGEHPIQGKEWIERAPLMNMYSSMVLK